jgi:hypothetical protein
MISFKRKPKSAEGLQLARPRKGIVNFGLDWHSVGSRCEETLLNPKACDQSDPLGRDWKSDLQSVRLPS